MKDSFDIVIVGAGPAGLATARYLNERGFHDVTILEKCVAHKRHRFFDDL